jgi:hypothetical protein
VRRSIHSAVGADLSQPKEVLPIIDRIQKFLADLEAHTSMLVHHTPKDGKGFWGSVIIEGTVHAMIHCQVNEKIPDTATLTCERMKGTRKFAPIDVTLQAQVIKTEPDEDGVDEVEELVVISGAPAAVEAKKAGGKEVREEELDELMWTTALALSRPPERLIQYTAWFEVTKANRGGKLGTETFDKAVKRLCKAELCGRSATCIRLWSRARLRPRLRLVPALPPLLLRLLLLPVLPTSRPYGREVPEVEVGLLEVLPEVRK